MESETDPVSPAPRGGLPFSVVLAIVAAATVGFSLLLRQATPVPDGLPEKPAPEIRVAGWLNGPGPTADDLKGKVIVLDAWAYWCNPCRAAAPELVKLYDSYKGRGVVFLGLTGEGQDA